MEIDMKGKWILVTGASSGIGEGVVGELDKAGANVVLVGRNEEKLQEVASGMANQAIVVKYDLSDLENMEEIFTTVYKQGIVLDGMVHSAGISVDIPVKVLQPQDLRTMMEVNYFSFVMLGRFFYKKKYSNPESSIVAISSAAAFMCDKGMSQYSASKAALNATVKTMSKEFLNRRIRVNAIAPCFVDTGMTWNVGNYVEGFADKLTQTQPLGVIPREQIAYVVLFLLSEYSRYITGDIIPITGGQTLHY